MIQKKENKATAKKAWYGLHKNIIEIDENRKMGE